MFSIQNLTKLSGGLLKKTQKLQVFKIFEVFIKMQKYNPIGLQYN